jgi:site-specific DNA recombinase
MWDMMLSGLYSPPKIRDIANNEWGFRTRPTRKMGGKPFCMSAIYQLFTKPFYYGWFEYPSKSGQWYQGRHDPLVTEAEFNRVQAMLGRTGNPRPKKNSDFAFTGLIRCGECDSMVTAEDKYQIICSECRHKFASRNRNACPRCEIPIEKMTGATFLYYTYYHCTKQKNRRCTQKSVSAPEMERQIDGYLARVQISERFKEWAIKYLHELHVKESSSRNDIIRSQQSAYRNCILRIDNLVKLKTAPGNADGSQLSDEEYGRQRVALLKEKAAIEEMLRDAGHRVEQWLDLSEKTFEFACVARTRFAKGDSKAKKEILLTIGSNLTLKGKKLNIEAKKPFLLLENSLSGSEPKKEQIEPENHGLPQRQKVETKSNILGRLGDLDEVRTRNQDLVKSIYAFYQGFTGTPYEIFPGWLSREQSVDVEQN